MSAISTVSVSTYIPTCAISIYKYYIIILSLLRLVHDYSLFLTFLDYGYTITNIETKEHQHLVHLNFMMRFLKYNYRVRYCSQKPLINPDWEVG